MQNIYKVHCTAERPDDDFIESVVGARAVLSIFLTGKHVAATAGAVKYALSQDTNFEETNL